MDSFEIKFTDKEIVNFEFFKILPGVYCYKTDTNAKIIAYAYISSSFKLIISEDLDRGTYEIHDWNSDNLNKISEDKHIICEFLGELAVRPLLEHGTAYDQKIAKTCWQVYSPQNTVENKLVLLIKDIFKGEITKGNL